MNWKVRKISFEDWISHLAEGSHLLAFGEKRPTSLERIDYALILVDDKNEIAAFITCKEMDSETVYWQYGGAMPQYKETIYSVKGYELLLNWARDHYNRIHTRIENRNLPMLRMALKLGFLVTGTMTFKNKIYLELANEFLEG